MTSLAEQNSHIVHLESGDTIELPLPIPQAIEVAYKVMGGDLVTVQDIASYITLANGEEFSVSNALKLITNQYFTQMVHSLSMAAAKLAFDAVAFNQLIHLARFSQAERVRIQAIRTLADMTGLNESKKKTQVNVNIDIDSIVREKKVSPFPGV